MSNLIKILAIVLGLAFSIGAIALAQEKPTTAVIEAVNLDEDIQAEDLGIDTPRLLPDSPFYFLKNWSRGLQGFFTFNPVGRAELKMKFANEKLMELKKIVQKTSDPEIIKKAVESYQQEVEKIKEQVEKIKEKAKDDPEVDKFLDKFIHQQTLHQKLLQKLENQVPPEVFEKIKTARERHLERFQEVMLKLEDRKEEITEKLDEILEKQEGSKYKNFKNLEVLLELEEKVPEEAKEAIRRAQENALKRLKGDLEKMSPEDQEKFKEYLENISGEKEVQMEILENLKEELEDLPEIRERIIQGRDRVLEKIEERGCPVVEKPAPGFCEEGRIVIKKDEKGCIVSFECLIPAETEIPERPEKTGVCITLWDPVCGKDGKTYSNECFAELAGAEVDYKGVCEISEAKTQSYCQTDADCGCGVNKITGECFYGNKNYVSERQQCPDFCAGLHGKFIIKCIENECQQALR